MEEKGGYGGNGDSKPGHMISVGKRFGTYLLFFVGGNEGKMTETVIQIRGMCSYNWSEYIGGEKTVITVCEYEK